MREGLLAGPRADGRTRILSGPIFSGPAAYANLVNFFQAIEISVVNHLPAEHFDFRGASPEGTEIELHFGVVLTDLAAVLPARARLLLTRTASQ